MTAALFALFVTGAAPSVGWLDTGSLAGSAWNLGVAHPPGEPGWLAPVRLAQLIPVGDIAFRANLFSALVVAALAAPLLWMSRAVGAGRGSWPGLFAVGIALLGYGARLQAHRAEVYGLVALLLFLALVAAVRWTGPRASAALGGLVGLAAAVHPLLAAAAAPGILLARWLRSPCRGADVLHGVGWGLVGFAAYAWLPLRALADPARAWGVPSTPGRFVDVLLGRSFARNFGGEGASFANILVVVERHALSGVLVAALLGGIAWYLRREERRGEGDEGRARRALAWAAPLWLVGNAMTILPQNKVFGTNPDLLGYLFVGTLAVAPLGALGLATLLETADQSVLARLKRPLLAVAALAVALQLFDGRAAVRTDNDLARRFATAQSSAVPPGSVLVTSGNNTAFVWTYLQGVEKRRADLIALHRVLLGHEHERLRLEEDLADLGVAWAPGLRASPVWALRGVAAPVFVEVRDAERSFMGSELSEHGIVWQLGGGQESEALAAVRAQTLACLEGPLAFGDEEAGLVAAFHRAVTGHPR